MAIAAVTHGDLHQAVSVAELRRNFAYWQEKAAQSPVLVVWRGQPRLVLASAAAFLGRVGAERPPAPVTYGSGEELVVDHTNQGFVSIGRDWEILAVNPVFEEMVGLPASQLVGRRWLDVFAALTDSFLAAQYRHVMWTGQAMQFEFDSEHSPGRRYAAHVFPHANGIAALFSNRTPEHRMRQALEEYGSLEQSFALVPHAAYLHINLRGYVEGASTQFEALTGFSISSQRRLQFSELVRLRDRRRLAESLEDVLNGGAPRRHSTSLLKSDGGMVPVDLAFSTLRRGQVVDGAMAFLVVDSSCAPAPETMG